MQRWPPRRLSVPSRREFGSTFILLGGGGEWSEASRKAPPCRSGLAYHSHRWGGNSRYTYHNRNARWSPDLCSLPGCGGSWRGRVSEVSQGGESSQRFAHSRQPALSHSPSQLPMAQPPLLPWNWPGISGSLRGSLRRVRGPVKVDMLKF